MKKQGRLYALHLDCFNALNTTLAEESDRACIVLVVAWVDYFLKVKLMNEFSKGSAKARKQLFSLNGAFATFSAKLNAAFCAGWIDSDVYHDLQTIKKLRNEFAHSVEPLTLNDERVLALLESLRVPRRQYSDFGELRVSSTGHGLVIYTGERPTNAEKDLHIPGRFTFQQAICVIVAVLVANLDILFETNEDGCLAKLKLPKHMESAQQKTGGDSE